MRRGSRAALRKPGRRCRWSSLSASRELQRPRRLDRQARHGIVNARRRRFNERRKLHRLKRPSTKAATGPPQSKRLALEAIEFAPFVVRVVVPRDRRRVARKCLLMDDVDPTRGRGDQGAAQEAEPWAFSRLRRVTEDREWSVGDNERMHELAAGRYLHEDRASQLLPLRQ